MIQRREDFGFAPEPRETIGIDRDGRRQNFERHLPLQIRISGAIDLAHSAGANLRADFVWA